MRIAAFAAATLFLQACQTSRPGPLAETGDTGPQWHVHANLVESCCCDAICPCMVGSPPTKGYCIGNRLVEITEGEYGGVDLDGVALVLTFRLREWSKLYFAEETTPEQVAATRSLLKEVWSGLLAEVRAVERVPLDVERTGTKVTYATPASRTEIEVMRGKAGEPVRVENLRSFDDYTQYLSVAVTHTATDEGESFELAGTNGFTATFAASGPR